MSCLRRAEEFDVHVINLSDGRAGFVGGGIVLRHWRVEGSEVLKSLDQYFGEDLRIRAHVDALATLGLTHCAG